jgi:preprotein translocase subunit SecA
MILPYMDRMRVKTPEARQVYKGLNAWVHGLKGRWYRHRLCSGKRLSARAQAIVTDSHDLKNANGKALLNELLHLYDEYRKTSKAPAEAIDRILVLVCELSRRALGIKPYPEQVEGALVIHNGAIAEMATGEGKSLTAAMSAILFAAAGKPVHVLTANDYLAERDATEMRPLFKLCGLSANFVNAETTPDLRAHVYAQDIVYTTGKELLGDYLRDRLKVGKNPSDLERAVERTLLAEKDRGKQLNMRGLYAVVVDEVDNVLVDEAVTPLILSVPRENPLLSDATMAANACVSMLEKGNHYEVLLRHRQIRWTQQGEKMLSEVSAHLPTLWQGSERCLELMTMALQAKELFHRDEHYVVLDEKIVLVDELTGRLTPNRNLGIGLQQAVEAKEALDITLPTETIARLSFQKFFRLFPRLGGLSGTVREAAAELWRIYHVPVVPVATHKPMIRKELPWRFFRNEQDKLLEVVSETCKAYAAGQPVLIGTRTVEASERLALLFEEPCIQVQVLNAVRHREEAQIIAQAGKKGAVTIATNMAGRGTDIKLGKGVAELGGVYVISLEPQGSKRLDRQLFGRSGRQGDPGCVRPFVSIEDFLILRFVSKFLRVIFSAFFRSRIWGGQYLLRVSVNRLQAKSERLAASQRLTILKSDDWLKKHLSFPSSPGQ